MTLHTNFSYPKDSENKKKWINATGRGPNWFPTEHSRICSAHFEPICFQPLKKVHRLFEWAIPTLKLHAVLMDSPQKSLKCSTLDFDNKLNREDQHLVRYRFFVSLKY